MPRFAEVQRSITMAKLRPVAPEDAEAVGRLLLRTNMGSSDPSARQDLWQNYPFAGEFPDVPTGWVLVDDNGEIVGNIDNVRTLYRLGDRLVRATVAASWVVEPSARSQSLQLIATFLRQKNIDLPLVVSASPTTAQVMTAMKIERIPIPDYAIPFFWPLRYRAFAGAALKRKAVPAAQLAAWPAGWAMWARDAYYCIRRESTSTKVRRLSEFDDRFDKLAR